MPPTIVLRRTDIAELLTVDDCLAAVEPALRAHVAGQALPPAILGVPSADGGFHVKAAGLLMSRPYFAAKTNANFPGNPARFGLPAIQGVVALFDAANGALLALMDSGLMTRKDVHAELPAVVAGLRPGRTSDEEITLFDSTGTALQDVAAAVAAYEKAVRLGRGETIDLGQ